MLSSCPRLFEILTGAGKCYLMAQGGEAGVQVYLGKRGIVAKSIKMLPYSSMPAGCRKDGALYWAPQA